MGLFLAMALTATVAWAGGMGRGFGWGPGYGYPAVPNLTAEQSSKIQALQKAHLEKITPLQQELYAKKLELRRLWLEQDPDQVKINGLQKEILDLVDEIQQASIQLRTEILKAINP